jgi:UDP-N-acetylglucosamine--N-acetylmuramyl-(pentapeptide) pyrophosphoryl-undecaprenol N-acetylglucosamine transferase
MDHALAAASVVISRAGASCLAELAAMRTPAVLVPFPAAADNHQWHNARQFEQTGAACLLEQKLATPDTLCRMIGEFLDHPGAPDRASTALAGWHKPHAAAEIAEQILRTVTEMHSRVAAATQPVQPPGDIRHGSLIA